MDNEYDKIVIRRCEAIGEGIQFHMDDSHNFTLQVPLNNSYSGGQVVYCAKDGFKKPSREIGMAITHDDKVIHGVTQLTSGVRYSLFFLRMVV